MCRVEYKLFTCGHTEDHSVDCELAQSFGPFFNRTGCVNYDFNYTHAQTQCGNVMGFYCAKTQNGMIIEKSREALQRLGPHFQKKDAEKKSVCASWNTYREQTLARGHSLDSLVANPTYRNIEHQREELIKECNGLESRRQYLNGLIAHAYRNRHLLELGVTFQPLWDGKNFDFAASIFPPQLLAPIRGQIPNQSPTPIVPSARSTMEQHLPQQGMDPPPVANFGMTAPPLQKTRSTQHQMGSVTPKRQADVMEGRSPVGEDIVRGHTPEGETREEKAVRYRDQLKAASAQKMADSMAKQGYTFQQLAASPAPKVGGRRPPGPKPTPPANNGSPMGPPKKVKASSKVNAPPTPRVRRSARTRNTKPKYTDSPGDPELDISPTLNATERSDPAWNASAYKSDDSWSPEMQAAKGGRGKNRRATLNSTASSAGSPTRGKASLSNKIADYQRSIGSLGVSGQKQGAIPSLDNPFQSGPQSTSNQTPQTPHTIGGLPYPGQQQLGSNSPSTYPQLGHAPYPGGPMGGQPPTMTQDAYQGASAMQRSTYLAQQLGRQLYQQQVASGIVGAATGASPSSQSPQEAGSPRMPYTSHAAQTRAPSASPLQSAPGHFGGMNYGGLPMAPANIFQQNYQQSMGQVPMGRSFSTGSLPAPGGFSPGSPMPTLNSNFQPNAPPSRDYESMRRSFSSTANLTPQPVITGNHAVPDFSPTKRSMPPSSPTDVRKRPRLSLPGQSLPGEDEAPVLRPSTSSFQLHAPAGLPADDTVDFAASIAAIEEFEREHAAAQPTALTTSDPQHPTPHDEAIQAHTDTYEITNEHTNETAVSNSQIPQYSSQSYETTHNLGDAILIPSNMVDQNSQLSEPSDFNQETNQQGQNDANNNFHDDENRSASEPEWDLLADDVFYMP